MKLLFLAVLILSSCGSSHSDSQGDQATQPSQSQSMSYMIKDEAALPTCDASRENQLVYISSTGEFKGCSSSVWAVLTVKGKDGAAGKDGTIGSNGKDAPALLDESMWLDPITKRTWLFGGGVVRAQASCPSGYRAPSFAEASEAYANGMGAILSVRNYGAGMWLPDHADGRFSYSYSAASGAFMQGFTTSATQAYRLVCYK